MARRCDLAQLSSKLAQFGKLRHSESQTAPTPVERKLVCDNRKQLIKVAPFMKKFSHRSTPECVCEWTSCLSWSRQAVPYRATTAMSHQKPLFNEIAERCFKGVWTGAELTDYVARGDPAMISNVIQDSDGQFRQRCKRPFFSLNLGGQSAFLLLQSPHKEQ